MSEAVVLLKLAKSVPSADCDLVGADRGALAAAEAGVRMKLAVGDFDSVSEEEFAKIQSFSEEVIRLPHVKDDSDSEAAVRFLLGRGYEKIVLWEPFGGRADHSYVNLRLCSMFPGKVILQDTQNRVEAYPEGEYRIAKEEYEYISFFASPEAVISLKDFLYELDERAVGEKDLYTLSNEWKGEEGILTVHSGCVLCMRTKDIKKIS